jgi:hypothetical protein
MKKVKNNKKWGKGHHPSIITEQTWKMPKLQQTFGFAIRIFSITTSMVKPSSHIASLSIFRFVISGFRSSFSAEDQLDLHMLFWSWFRLRRATNQFVDQLTHVSSFRFMADRKSQKHVLRYKVLWILDEHPNRSANDHH